MAAASDRGPREEPQGSSVDDAFYRQPILNSPYEMPRRHWELDGQVQPTQELIEQRRLATFISPIPRARKRNAAQQTQLLTAEG